MLNLDRKPPEALVMSDANGTVKGVIYIISIKDGVVRLGLDSDEMSFLKMERFWRNEPLKKTKAARLEKADKKQINEMNGINETVDRNKKTNQPRIIVKPMKGRSEIGTLSVRQNETNEINKRNEHN